MKSDSNAADNVYVTSSQILMLMKCVHCSPCYFSHTLPPRISRLRDAPHNCYLLLCPPFSGYIHEDLHFPYLLWDQSHQGSTAKMLKSDLRRRRVTRVMAELLA